MKRTMWRAVRLSGLLLLAALFGASPVRAHEGHAHGAAPKPRTAQERLVGVFIGMVPDQMPTTKAIAVSHEAARPGRSPVRIRTIYAPPSLLIGRGEPFRMEFRDGATGEPLTGYAPRIVLTFRSGGTSRGSMEEVRGYPGLYQYWATWQEPGMVDVRVTIGQGESAPLPEHVETLHVKAPPVPLGSWLFVGSLVSLLLGVIGSYRVAAAARPIVFLIAAGIGLGGALVIRAPIAAAASTFAGAESAMLATQTIEKDVDWPEAQAAVDFAVSSTSPSLTAPSDGSITTTTDLPAGPAVIRGHLITPDDARAVVSSPYIGIFSTTKLLPRGTTVRRGQSLGSIRVNNEAIAPDAAAAPGAIAAAESELAAAQSILAQAEADLARGHVLYDADAISTRELEGFARAVEQAQAAVAAADGSLAAAKKQGQVLQGLGGSSLMRSHGLSSPINGVIAEIGVAAGEALTEGQMIYTIIDPTRLWIEAQVFEDQLAGLVPGATHEFVVASDSSRRYTATIRSLGLTLDPESRTLPVLLDVVPPFEGLYAGQSILLLAATEAAP